MWSSKKYRRLTPVHLLLLITGNEVVELVTSNQFNLGETFQNPDYSCTKFLTTAKSVKYNKLP